MGKCTRPNLSNAGELDLGNWFFGKPTSNATKLPCLVFDNSPPLKSYFTAFGLAWLASGLFLPYTEVVNVVRRMGLTGGYPAARVGGDGREQSSAAQSGEVCSDCFALLLSVCVSQSGRLVRGYVQFALLAAVCQDFDHLGDHLRALQANSAEVIFGPGVAWAPGLVDADWRNLGIWLLGKQSVTNAGIKEHIQKLMRYRWASWHIRAAPVDVISPANSMFLVLNAYAAILVVFLRECNNAAVVGQRGAQGSPHLSQPGPSHMAPVEARPSSCTSVATAGDGSLLDGANVVGPP